MSMPMVIIVVGNNLFRLPASFIEGLFQRVQHHTTYLTTPERL
jgi:hypothetical protein